MKFDQLIPHGYISTSKLTRNHLSCVDPNLRFRFAASHIDVLLMSCWRLFKRLGSVGYNPNIFHLYLGVSKYRGKTPKSSILIGFSIIFTIHFGGFPPIFGGPPIYK